MSREWTKKETEDHTFDFEIESPDYSMIQANVRVTTTTEGEGPYTRISSSEVELLDWTETDIRGNELDNTPEDEVFELCEAHIDNGGPE